MGDSDALLAAGQPDAAVAVLEAALTGEGAAWGEADERTLTLRCRLADALDAAGRRDDAIEAAGRALDAGRQLAPNSALTAQAAYQRGRYLDDAGRYRESLAMHDLALNIRARTLDLYAADTNESRYEVAELSRVIGHADEAEYLYRQAIKVEHLAGRPVGEFGARLRNNFADLLIHNGRAEEVGTLIDEAIKIRRQIYGEDHERVWRSTLTRAAWLLATGKAGEVRALAAAGRKRGGAMAANWFLLGARAALARGHHASALREAIAVLRAFARTGADRVAMWEAYCETLETAFRAALALRRGRELLPYAAGLPAIARSLLPTALRGSSETNVATLVRQGYRVVSLWLLVLAQAASAASSHLAPALAFTQQIKGLRTRYLRWRLPGTASVLRIEPSAVLVEREADLAQLASLRATFVELQQAALGQVPRPMHLLRTLLQINFLERHLSGDIDDVEISLDDPGDVAALIPEQTLVLEYIRTISGDGPARYLAFAIRRDATSLVDLGFCAQIDNAVDDLRSSLFAGEWREGGPEPPWLRRARFLGARLLAPFAEVISQVRHVVVCPDGSLGAVPFEILTLPSGGYLLDAVDVSYQMRAAELGRAAQFVRRGTPPLVIGGPDFDLPGAYVGTVQNLTNVEGLLAAALGDGNRFTALPGAAEDARDVAVQLGVVPLVGVWALASELARNSSPEILHIATHGFCLPYRATLAEAKRSPDALNNALDLQMLIEDPMQRSGLALSGANAALDGRVLPEEAGRGRVMAVDIQALDLQQTDLAVVAACRSGLGEAALADGVHGLRRAFLAAGCHSVVSALWDVPDASAHEQMRAFYERLLAGQTRLAALQASRAQLRARFPRDPVYWAGFVLDGNCGRLARFEHNADLKVASVSFREWGVATDGADMATLAAAIASGGARDKEARRSVAQLRRDLARPNLPDGERADLQFALGDRASRLGAFAEAIRLFEAMLASDNLSFGRRAQLRYNIAKNRQQAGDFEGAVGGYDEVLRSKPEPRLRAATLVNCSIALNSLGRHADAIAALTAVIEATDSPADQLALALGNRSNLLIGCDPNRALADLDQLFASDIARLPAETVIVHRLNRASLSHHLGRSEDALRQLDELEASADIPDSLRRRVAELRTECG